MNYDSEFIKFLATYIAKNDANSKKYLNAFWMKFLDIKKSNSFKSTNIAYRLWNFNDSKIMDFIYGKEIKIIRSGFLSYFSNIGNTKYMVDYLEIDEPTKLFYLIEEQRDEFLDIYIPLEEKDNNSFSNEDIEYIDEVLEAFKKENEVVRINNDSYSLNYKNVKAILIHEWLGELLEIEGMHKFKNGYYYLPLNKNTILELRDSIAVEELREDSFYIDSKGCVLLDDYYDIGYYEYLDSLEKKKEDKEEEKPLDLTPIKVNFKPTE